MALSAVHHPTVLVADDDELVLLAVRIALQADGCAVVEARSGEQVSAAANSGGLDAIIVDANMPGWSLVETLDSLQNSPETARIPVLVLSGAPVVLGARESFVVSFLHKPVSLETLTTAVRAATSNQPFARSGSD